MALDLDPKLLEIIRCPDCRATLAVVESEEGGELVCDGCGLAYPVLDGHLPVLLVDKARKPA